MKKPLKRYLYLGRKYNKFRFGEKRKKIRKYGVVAGIFHKHAVTQHAHTRYQNSHKLTDLHVTKNLNDSVNFIGSRDIYGISNNLDISAEAARLRLIVNISFCR